MVEGKGQGAGTAAVPKQAEVVVIGGGVAGVSAAYFLAKRGVPVVLCEKGRIAGEQSSRNWGWVRKQGRDPLELPAIIEAMRIWEGLQEDLDEDIGWHQGGTTYLATSEKDLASLESWLAHARQYQLDSRILSPAETDQLLGQEGRQWKGALFTPSDGRAEPAKAVPALAKACERLGAAVLTNCAVRTLEVTNGQVSGVVTERGKIACRAVVCAAGAWTGLFCRNLDIELPQLSVKASVQRTHPAPLFTESGVSSGLAALRRRQDGGYTLARSGTFTFDIVPDALRHFWTFLPALATSWKTAKLRIGRPFLEALAQPRHWGPDEVTAFERTRVLDPLPDHGALDKVLATAQRQFPQLAGVGWAERWAGMIETTPDALPVLCEAEGPKGFFVATGFSGHGFGMGPGAGLLLSELILDGRTRCDLTPFRLARFADGSKLRPYSVL